MVVTAHPDDFELCCAGDGGPWMSQGWQARLVLVTSGDKGTAARSDDRHDRAAGAASQRSRSRRRPAPCWG